MDIQGFMSGFWFSLETFSTVGTCVCLSLLSISLSIHLSHPSSSSSSSSDKKKGYGAPGEDTFFGGCKAPAFVVTLQIFVSIFTDAMFIGLIFLRFSRPHKRAQTLLFSEVAVIHPSSSSSSSSSSSYTFSLRVAELTRYELINPRVRMYAIRHSSSSSSPTFYQTYALPLAEPASSILLMTLPATVSHLLSPSSPLVPPGWREGDEEALAKFWEDVAMEVVVLIEGPSSHPPTHPLLSETRRVVAPNTHLTTHPRAIPCLLTPPD